MDLKCWPTLHENKLTSQIGFFVHCLPQVETPCSIFTFFLFQTHINTLFSLTHSLILHTHTTYLQTKRYMVGKDYYARRRLLMCSKRISTHKECPKNSVCIQSSCKVLKLIKLKKKALLNQIYFCQVYSTVNKIFQSKFQ